MDDLIFLQEIMLAPPKPKEFQLVPKSVADTFTDDEILASDLNGDEIMIVYRDTDFTCDINKMQVATMKTNFCVTFTVNIIIQEILTSYSNGNTKQNIMDQFNMDFFRMSMHLNSIKCHNMEFFKKSIEKYKKYSHHIMDNLYDLIIMLSTQSSFYYPFKIVHDVYDLPESNIRIISDTDRPNINIIDHNTSIDIIFKKTFKYINIENRQILNRFYTSMILTIDLVTIPSGYIFSAYHYCQADSSVLYWIRESDTGIG